MGDYSFVLFVILISWRLYEANSKSHDREGVLIPCHTYGSMMKVQPILITFMSVALRGHFSGLEAMHGLFG